MPQTEADYSLLQRRNLMIIHRHPSPQSPDQMHDTKHNCPQNGKYNKQNINPARPLTMSSISMLPV